MTFLQDRDSCVSYPIAVRLASRVRCEIRGLGSRQPAGTPRGLKVVSADRPVQVQHLAGQEQFWRFLARIVRESTSSSATPPAVTSALPKPSVPVTGRRRRFFDCTSRVRSGLPAAALRSTGIPAAVSSASHSRRCNCSLRTTARSFFPDASDSVRKKSVDLLLFHPRQQVDFQEQTSRLRDVR